MSFKEFINSKTSRIILTILSFLLIYKILLWSIGRSEYTTEGLYKYIGEYAFIFSLKFLSSYLIILIIGLIASYQIASFVVYLLNKLGK